MDPATLMAIIGAGIGGVESLISGIGMGKAKKGAEAAVSAIPTYTASPEVQKYLELRRRRLGTGLGAEARAIAQQGIGTAAAGATKSALSMGKGAGLGTIGAIQKQAQKGSQELALKESGAELANIAGYGQGVQMSAAERARQFASEQERQQLKANIELEKLAARRAMLAQGLSAMTGGLTSAAISASYGSSGRKSGSSSRSLEQMRSDFGTYGY